VYRKAVKYSEKSLIVENELYYLPFKTSAVLFLARLQKALSYSVRPQKLLDAKNSRKFGDRQGSFKTLQKTGGTFNNEVQHLGKRLRKGF